MKPRLAITCVLLALILILGNSTCSHLFNYEQTVFINDVDHVDGAECVWFGSQSFKITHEQFTAIIYITPFYAESPHYSMDTLIGPRGNNQPGLDSIQFQLVHTIGKGQVREIPLIPQFRPPRVKDENGKFKSWSQDFRVSEVIEELTEGHISLVWSMDYRDANGKMKRLSIRVPLRKVKIVIPNSIVNLDSCRWVVPDAALNMWVSVRPEGTWKRPEIG